jgi:hypothetical protein
MNQDITLKTFTNEVLFTEVARRLKLMHLQSSGKEFLFGDIAFVFRDGKLQGIEERSKLRLYKTVPGSTGVVLKTV